MSGSFTDVFDYLAWRGDLTLDRSGFNEVDGMILARFAYIPFEYFAVPLPDRPISIGEMAKSALADEDLRREERWKFRDEELLTAMAGSARFRNAAVSAFEQRLDEKLQMQFAAITVELAPDLTAVLFRGTDNTVVGWKEDLNMSYLSPVPGQVRAAAYLRRAAETAPGRLVVCGHSKGGNLAVYAGAFCGEGAQEKTEAVYNYDGPGFFDKILDTAGYEAISDRIRTFVPQFSVVGMLLGHPEGHAVVHSRESGLMQHDVYSWEVYGPRFRTLETVTGGSRFLDSTIKDWTADMTPEQFEKFTDTIYTLFTDTNMTTMHEMKENWFETARSFVHTVADMDETTRTAALEAVKLLAKSAGREAVEALQGV